MDLEAWARAEMAKAATDSEAFERRLKERLDQRLAGRRRFQAHDNDGVWVEEVRLEGSYPETTGLIILRDDRQPDCLLAWRLGEVWDWRAFGTLGRPIRMTMLGGSRCTWTKTWRPSTTGFRSDVSKVSSRSWAGRRSR